VLYVSPSTYTIQLTISIAASSIFLTFHSTTASHSMYYLSQTLDERLTIAHSRPSCSTSRWVAKFVSTRHETHNWAIPLAILLNPYYVPHAGVVALQDPGADDNNLSA
jgi:hypothetical protein